jgi:hypothetical protein
LHNLSTGFAQVINRFSTTYPQVDNNKLKIEVTYSYKKRGENALKKRTLF